jgi:arginine N-succinyltransferase
MFRIRAARAADLDELVGVSEHLDSVNLPSHREKLAAALERAEQSFAGVLDSAKREYMFVLENGADGRVVGSSMIFAQHGSRNAPHVFFDVLEEERYSASVDRHVHHRVLRMGYNYRGLTEMGGLVLLPEFRGHPARLGKLLSYVRFLYVALHRDLFRDEIVSELMPPLEEDGRSLLWESLGRRFTGMTYQEADQLSRENKEFIKALFPEEPIYACLLDEGAQAILGEVGPGTKGVEHMLRQIGFRYANRIDPFDGGPHFQAPTDEVTLIKSSRAARLVDVVAPGARTIAAIAMRESVGPPYVTAIVTPVDLANDTVALAEDARAGLGAKVGDRLGVLPLETLP